MRCGICASILRTGGPAPRSPGTPRLGLTQAQATYCFRRELDLRPKNREMLRTLQVSFELRGMNDARDFVERFREHALPGEGLDLSGDQPPRDLPGDLSGAIAELLRLRRPLAAAALARAAEQIGMDLPWETADRVAVALLQLGDPASARRLWDRATAPTGVALRLARIGEAELASLDFAAATRSLRRRSRTRSKAWRGMVRPRPAPSPERRCRSGAFRVPRRPRVSTHRAATCRSGADP